MSYRWLKLAGLSLMISVTADVGAFSIPLQQKDIAASKLAHIQLNAASGDARAQYLLALMQLSGKYTVKNMLQGAHWLEKAAEQGHIKAQQTLADLSFEGKLVTRNLKVAERWYLELAQTGERWAQFRLGFIYASGDADVPRHCGKALEYFYQVGDTVAMGNAAWILSTCPEAEFRDGNRALNLSLELLKDNHNDPTCLDNLAAAYAELGKFDDAVATQKKAIYALAGTKDSSKINGFKARLEHYQARKAYREVLPLHIQD